MKNESGVHPTEFKVVIRPDVIEEKTSGGIYIPETTRDREKWMLEEGTFIEASPNAFEIEWREGRVYEWKRKPKPGDRVMYDKFAGKTFKGKDGLEYRIMQDKNIGAIIDE